MFDPSALASLALLGLAGSLHCAGMCGPFVIAMGWRREGASRPAARMTAYVLGKCAAYVLLALAVALGASTLSGGIVDDREHALHAARNALAWLAGGLMVLAGLHALGLPWLRSSRAAAVLHAPFAALIRSARTLPPLGAALALGLINGCLPCGLSWSAILFAASQDGATVVLGPLVFGLATAPSLTAVAAGGALVPLHLRARLQRAAAVALVLFGAWTAWRGGLGIGAPENNLPPCCRGGHAGEP
jgi:sulfite exporter TauE/SafE